MEFDDSSMISTPPEEEPVMEYSLMLTTLSGETFQVSLSVAKFDRFEDLEEQVMDYLVSVTDLKVFGCCIDFLQTATQTYLCLLYTSPSPRDGLLSRMPSSA